MSFLEHLTDKRSLITLFVIGLIVYYHVFFNGFVGDDSEQILNFNLVKGLTEVPKVFFFHHVVIGSEHSLLGAYYKPLMLFYFYTIRAIFGVHPFFYHAPQVILFIINSFFVYKLFTHFFKKYIALFLSILFLIHPINQETGAYISNIQEVLFFLFGIVALLLLLKPNKTLKHFVSIGVLLLLSLLSKETGILFVAIVSVYVFLFERKEIKKIIFTIVPVVGAYFVLRILSQTTSAFWIEPPPMAYVSFQDRLLHAPSLFWYYIQTFFYPSILAFNQQWIIKDFTFPSFFLPLLLSLIFFFLIFFFYYYLYKSRQKQKSVFLFFTIWMFIGILPHLQLLPLDATVANRWFYFASVGLIGILGVLWTLFITRFKKHEKTVLFITIAACVVLSFRTMHRNTQWINAFTLYRNDYHISSSALLENNLGDEYFKQEDFVNAEKHFKNALILSPSLWIATNNLGILEEKKGNLIKAEMHYKKALSQGKRLPIVENIARVLVLQNKNEEAISLITKEISNYPYSSNLLLTLSLSYYNLEEFEKARIYAQKSYNLSPNEKVSTVLRAIDERIE